MASNLKLEIFRISLKKRGGKNTDLKNFKELFELLDIDKKESYRKFVEDFINHFESQFKMNADGNKGISTSSSSRFTPNSAKNIINGEVYGGPSDIDSPIYDKGNANNSIATVNEGNIISPSYFFKLWTPYDHTTGVLMVQSYPNGTITALLKTQLSNFIKQYGYSLIMTPYIPNDVLEKYKSESEIVKVTYVKEKLTQGKRKLLNPIFTDFENLKVKITVSGFNTPVQDFAERFFGADKTIGSNLEDFDIKEEDDYAVVTTYKDKLGHKATTRIKRNFDLKPTVFLPNEIKEDGKNRYDFDRIVVHTNDVLVNIQKEIKYIK